MRARVGGVHPTYTCVGWLGGCLWRRRRVSGSVLHLREFKAQMVSHCTRGASDALVDPHGHEVVKHPQPLPERDPIFFG